MTIRSLLARLAAQRARGRAARLARAVALLGATAVALALFLERSGVDLPFIRLPAMPASRFAAERVFGYLAVSLAGLVQGLLLLAGVLAGALLVRVAGPWCLRATAARTAAEVDRRLATDRFCAALEGAGPFGDFARRRALADPPDPALLRPQRPGRLRRALPWIAALAVLLVALAPGRAPGTPGSAAVAGEPEGGGTDEPLRLRLLGEERTFQPGERIPVDVVAEARSAPARDVDLELAITIDGGEPRPLSERLFLPAGAAGEAFARFDLRRFARDLAPGEHRAVARSGELESNVYRFRIAGEQGAGRSPPPQPPPGETPPPPAADEEAQRPEWRPRFVEPLVREGATVEKNARVPVEVPGGGGPAEKPLAEAWPELERRREAALRRAGLSPEARRIVRDYFDRLRGEAK